MVKRSNMPSKIYYVERAFAELIKFYEKRIHYWSQQEDVPQSDIKTTIEAYQGYIEEAQQVRDNVIIAIKKERI